VNRKLRDALREAAEEPLAVWALSEDYLNHPKARLERRTVEPQVTPSLDPQEGLFTWHPDAYASMTRGQFTPFESVVQEDFAQIRSPEGPWQARSDSSPVMRCSERARRAVLEPFGHRPAHQRPI
jgi:hypothetical protein